MWGQFMQSQLDTVLKKENFVIEDLLDEDNIVNDVKMNQSKYSDFQHELLLVKSMLKHPKHLMSLVKYSMGMPSENDSYEKKHKYPFIASELLGIQIAKIQEFLFSNSEEHNFGQKESSQSNETVEEIIQDIINPSQALHHHEQAKREDINSLKQNDEVPIKVENDQISSNKEASVTIENDEKLLHKEEEASILKENKEKEDQSSLKENDQVDKENKDVTLGELKIESNNENSIKESPQEILPSKEIVEITEEAKVKQEIPNQSLSEAIHSQDQKEVSQTAEKEQLEHVEQSDKQGIKEDVVSPQQQELIKSEPSAIKEELPLEVEQEQQPVEQVKQSEQVKIPEQSQKLQDSLTKNEDPLLTPPTELKDQSFDGLENLNNAKIEDNLYDEGNVDEEESKEATNKTLIIQSLHLEEQKVKEEEEEDLEPKILGKELLNGIFLFLEPQEELNSTSAGYFFKIVNSFINSKESQILGYFQKNPEIISKLIHHYYSKSISKLLIAIITQDGTDLNPDPFIDVRVNIINQMYQKFKDTTDIDVSLNIQDSLSQINQIQLRPQNWDLKKSLISEENISILLDSILKQKNTFSEAAIILSIFLDYFRSDLYPDLIADEYHCGFLDSNMNRGRDSKFTQEFPIALILSKSADLIQLCMQENLNLDNDQQQTQYGTSQKPFGLHRIKLLNLISCILKTENKTVCDALIDGEFLKYNLVTNKMFFRVIFEKFQWNNLLLNQIEQIIIEMFKIAIFDLRVRDSIVFKAKFFDFLVKCGLVNEVSLGSRQIKYSKGYQGIIVNFVQQIQSQKSQLPWLSESLDKTERWSELLDENQKAVQRMNQLLGKVDPRTQKSQSSRQKDDTMTDVQRVINQDS